jgi:regulatory protein
MEKVDIWQEMEQDKALQRITAYCAEAEHCTQDVVQKLTAWGVQEDVAGEILERLYREKFLDDARYAKSYVEEKWKLNQWGRIKMRHQLEAKGIAEELIDAALEVVSKEDYEGGVRDILDDKWKELKQKRDLGTLQKVAVFGAGRGIEEELITVWVEERVEGE